MKIFIVDDDMIYRSLASRLIKMIDPTVDIDESENGKIALDKLEESTDLSEKSVVLLDINMPVIDGWGFLEDLYKKSFFNFEQLEVYMVSSSTDESDIEKSQEYGFVKGFFHKPITKDNIKTLFDSD